MLLLLRLLRFRRSCPKIEGGGSQKDDDGRGTAHDGATYVRGIEGYDNYFPKCKTWVSLRKNAFKILESPVNCYQISS